MSYVDIGCRDSIIDQILNSAKLLSNEELCLLSKKLIKCKRWKWEAGMLLRSETCELLETRLSSSPDWDVHVFCGGYPVLSDEETLCVITNRIRLLTGDHLWFPHPLTDVGEISASWLAYAPSEKRQTRYKSCQEALVSVYSKL